MSKQSSQSDRFHQAVCAIYDWAKADGGNRTHGYSSYHVVTMLMRDGLVIDVHNFDDLMDAIDVVRGQ